MAGSSFGTLLRMTTWGESHGPAVGAVVDGCPAGLSLTEEDIQKYLDRRRPGQSLFTTSRKETDRVEILSGLFEGRTTGTPISLLIRSTSQRSGDYEDFRDVYRPGHADLGYDFKYGLRDHRGGGRSSGRETAARVAAGAVAARLLDELGVTVTAYTLAIGPVRISDAARCLPSVKIREAARNASGMPDDTADRDACAFIAGCREEQDSAGGIVECRIEGVPAGIGDPVFDKLDARLASAIMSIGAVKAVEVGDGTAAASLRGSENNDPFLPPDDPGSRLPHKASNHAGGILGGISDGAPILLRAHFKPTPSIGRQQETVNTEGRAKDLVIHGRHDPVIVPRAVVVVEAMCAAVLADAMLMNMSARTEDFLAFYRRKQ